jgi:hypothetical protein
MVTLLHQIYNFYSKEKTTIYETHYCITLYITEIENLTLYG